MMKLTASGGTIMPAPKAVRCLVRHTARLALVSASGTMPSVRHCCSLSLKYWHSEANTPTSSRTTAADRKRWPQLALTLMKYSSVVSYDLGRRYEEGETFHPSVHPETTAAASENSLW